MTKEQITPMAKILRRANRFECARSATVLRKSGSFVIIAWDDGERETFPRGLIESGFDLTQTTKEKE